MQTLIFELGPKAFDFLNNALFLVLGIVIGRTVLAALRIPRR